MDPALLSDLERAIVRLLMTGASDSMIAHALFVSERTVRRHIGSVMRALGAETRFQAGFMLARGAPQSEAPTTPMVRRYGSKLPVE